MRRGNNRGVREKESSIHWDQLVCGIKFMLESSMLIKKVRLGLFSFSGCLKSGLEGWDQLGLLLPCSLWNPTWTPLFTWAPGGGISRSCMNPRREPTLNPA